MRRRARWLLRGLAMALGALLAAAIAGGYWFHQRLETPYLAHPGAVDVEISSGTPARHILDSLEQAGVVRDAWVARLYLVYGLDDPPLRAGEYRFEGPLTIPQALDKLVRGAVLRHPVTVVEGLTLEETAAALASAGFGEHRALLAEMRDPSRIRDLDPLAETLEGYLFPDTYSFARGVSAKRVVDTLVQTFRRRFGEAAETGRLRASVTLASIVEKEAQRADERPLIAGVYRNRLARGIALYADPTLIFAKKQDGSWDGNLRKADLDMDSPYNTYRRAGLPPGPICSPGLASLEAAYDPADVPYLYFVSRNDGSHVFATTLAEHNHNVEVWQRRYWRRRWAEERRQRSPLRR